MGIVFFDCSMGAAGDMLGGALLDLFEDKDQVISELNSLGIPGVVFYAERTQKCGITGTHLKVEVNGTEEDEHMHEHHHDHNHEHEHSHDHDHTHSHVHASMHGITHLIQDHLNVNDQVKAQIEVVYQRIAEAESKVHGVPVEEIHFHEVGTMDALADITAVCYLMDKLNPDAVYASPVHVGRGTVKCAHGILPVPAPATALLLSGVPIYSREVIDGELCTPTGAALLKTFVKKFCEMPVMKTERIGYGMGKKDFPIANCVRAFWGEQPDQTQRVCELNFNVDDMTGEELSYVMNALLSAGAYEVYTTPIQMKKSRPGTLVTVICEPEMRDMLAKIIFRHSTTLGIRFQFYDRMILNREMITENTEFGPMRRKQVQGYGTERAKYEYEDLARAADETGCSIWEIRDKLTGRK